MVLLENLEAFFPESFAIYKAFLRPNIDYCDFTNDQPHNESICNNLEKLQYIAALAITGAIKWTSKLKIYEELGLESLKFRRWMRRLYVFYKIKAGGHSDYLYKLISAKALLIIQVIQITLKHIIAELIFLNIHFFLILLPNGTDWTTLYVIQNPTKCFRIHY